MVGNEVSNGHVFGSRWNTGVQELDSPATVAGWEMHSIDSPDNLQLFRAKFAFESAYAAFVVDLSAGILLDHALYVPLQYRYEDVPLPLMYSQNPFCVMLDTLAGTLEAVAVSVTLDGV